MARNSEKKGGKGELQLGFDMALVLPKRKEKSVSQKVETPLDGTSLLAGGAAPQTLALTQSSGMNSTGSLSGSHLSTSGSNGPEVLSVAQLTRRITTLLEDGIGTVWVEGEISNLRRQSSGHSYFTLKDDHSQLSCVLFARSASGQKVELRDGVQVQLYGQVTVYQARGQYQMIVSLVQLKGEGALQARFEELKRRLAAEGLFDQIRKRPLPRFPRRIGVVTSPTGAAIRDFLQVLHRRHPGLRVVINPVRVQGKGVAAEIASAITELSEGGDTVGPVDLIVVTRGGGSLEDLWEFNEEIVARAIADSLIPVVSAVGHEIDFSIADFVADLRAPTPSAAAELIAADGAELIDRCRSMAWRIGRETMALLESRRSQERLLASSALFREPLRRLGEARQACDRLREILSEGVDRRMERIVATLDTAAALLASSHPGQRIIHARQAVAALKDRLDSQILRRMERDTGRLERVRTALSAISPQATLARGFSITRTAEGKVVIQASQVKPGDRIMTQLAEGEIESKSEG
jgi:exodeoxyribonuclease VII large subunit